jgi:predicted dienelactone hydrolase
MTTAEEPTVGEVQRVDTAHQWIATDTAGADYLVTVYEHPSRRSPTGRPVLALEVAARLDATRWGLPMAIREIS